MAAELQSTVPRSFWIISGLALVWNLIGFANYLAQVSMTEETLMSLPEADRMLMESAPAWSTGAFGLAVTAGVLGSLLLLLRKSWATAVLVLSFGSVIVTMYYWLVMSDALAVHGPAGAVMPVLVIVIGALLVWYARYAGAKGWIS